MRPRRPESRRDHPSHLGRFEARGRLFYRRQRSARGIFLEMRDVSQIPAIAEPWFLAFNASIEIHPVMIPGDLAKAAALSTTRSRNALRQGLLDAIAPHRFAATRFSSLFAGLWQLGAGFLVSPVRRHSQAHEPSETSSPPPPLQHGARRCLLAPRACRRTLHHRKD
jgi:hypothetical protein